MRRYRKRNGDEYRSMVRREYVVEVDGRYYSLDEDDWVNWPDEICAGDADDLRDALVGEFRGWPGAVALHFYDDIGPAEQPEEWSRHTLGPFANAHAKVAKEYVVPVAEGYSFMSKDEAEWFLKGSLGSCPGKAVTAWNRPISDSEIDASTIAAQLQSERDALYKALQERDAEAAKLRAEAERLREEAGHLRSLAEYGALFGAIDSALPAPTIEDLFRTGEQVGRIVESGPSAVASAPAYKPGPVICCQSQYDVDE